MNIIKLAELARPIDHSDLGSSRQVEAEKTFFIEAEKVIVEYLGRKAFDQLEAFSFVSTIDETIDETIKLIKRAAFGEDFMGSESKGKLKVYENE